MSLSQVIETARAELGYTEWPKDSNRTKYGSEYGLDGQPWCVMFLWWCFRTAGLSELFCGGNRAADCGTLRRWYRERGQTVPVEEVRPGDILVLNFSGTDIAEHCGIVVETPIKNGKKIIRTIEGNTSPGEEGSQDNGGSVALKTRYPAQIVAVCRPLYSYEPTGADDWSGHWAEDAIRWCNDTGIMIGYKDGSFKPDKPVTRAELATVLKRALEKEG